MLKPLGITAIFFVIVAFTFLEAYELMKVMNSTLESTNINTLNIEE